MIKFFICFFIVLTHCKYAISRNIGETEITTEDGIEVFQEEKYYLLKKNVDISSDEFQLKGQIVKIYFDQDLYDIKEIIASEKVNFKSNKYNIKIKGEKLKFNIQNEIINVIGDNSELYLETTEMLSDGKIKINNQTGSFSINGPNSKLLSEKISIIGSKINGIFNIINGNRDISKLEVQDENIVNIKTEDTEMFSKKAIYDKKKSIIELFDDVKIKRGNEVITGDYGILDTNKNSYKVSSKNSNKVKVIISNTK